MTRKTKEEKKLAEYRRRLKQAQNSESPNKPTQTAVISQVKPLAVDFPRNNYFFQDLKKSLFMIITIITLEILIYFATINKYFANLVKF
ncbi:hypothetical protein HY357_01280 [Candidatus Roizmanbacteria bacterium]|nr:hypothetical protein [Candidatus Roizmanbacteria bacterium]